MNIAQAREQGLTKIRLAGWNEWAYLDIGESSWIYLYDVGCKRLPLLPSLWDTEFFEPWTPPLDYEERQDEIYTFGFSRER